MKKTTALQNEFTELLDVLGSNLVEITHKITDLQTELAQAEDEYDGIYIECDVLNGLVTNILLEVKTSALIEGLLGVAFTISAVVALSYGEGDLAYGFAIDAGTNFMDKIKDAIRAGQLVG